MNITFIAQKLGTESRKSINGCSLTVTLEEGNKNNAYYRETHNIEKPHTLPSRRDYFDFEAYVIIFKHRFIGLCE